MSKRSARRLVIAAAILSAGAAAAAETLPAYSADVVTRTKGDSAVAGKIYSNGARVRSEHDSGGQTTASILDFEAKKMWLLLPPPMGCVEQPLGDDPKNPFSIPMTSSKEELVGSETIDGHPTKKYRVTTTVKGKPYVAYQWRAPDLRNVVLKVTDEKASYETLYRNVKLGKPDAKLFEPPAKCGANPFGALFGGGGKK